MSSAKWLGVMPEVVTIEDLTATQPGVLLHALIGVGTPVGGDPLPHVIDWRGVRYLEDGHHRVMRALLRGEHTIVARVLHLGTGQRIAGCDESSLRHEGV